MNATPTPTPTALSTTDLGNGLTLNIYAGHRNAPGGSIATLNAIVTHCDAPAGEWLNACLFDADRWTIEAVTAVTVKACAEFLAAS